MHSVKDEPKIEKHEQITEKLESFEWRGEDGVEGQVEVDNPRLDGEYPTFLRVSIPRKGWTYDVLEEAESFGLEVTDIWQLEKDYENDRIKFKLELKED